MDAPSNDSVHGKYFCAKFQKWGIKAMKMCISIFLSQNYLFFYHNRKISPIIGLKVALVELDDFSSGTRWIL